MESEPESESENWTSLKFWQGMNKLESESDSEFWDWNWNQSGMKVYLAGIRIRVRVNFGHFWPTC